MGIFSSIHDAIFGHKGASAPGGSGLTGTSAKPGAPAASTGAGAGAAKPMTNADVEAMIEKRAAGHSDYDLRHSFVDLMKSLDLDSSFNARKQLAQELGYTGALDGSAQMNVWLHQQVMTKLAEGGGKLPETLKA
jgi:hypothetical protein